MSFETSLPLKSGALSTDGAGPWDEMLARLKERSQARAIAAFVNEVLGSSVLTVKGSGQGRPIVPVTSNVPGVSVVAASAEAAFVAGMNAVWTRIGEREPSPAELDEVFRIQDAREGALAKVMSEAEREHYEAARSGLLAHLHHDCAALNLSGDEALTLPRLRRYEADAAPSPAAPDSPGEGEVAGFRTQAVRDLLGNDRFAACQRLQNHTDVTLSDLGKHRGLSSAAVMQAYKLVRNSRSEVTPEGMAFDARLKGVLGDDGFNDWVQLGDAVRMALVREASEQAVPLTSEKRSSYRRRRGSSYHLS